MATDKSVEEVFQKELSKQFFDVVKKVLVSEKATRLIEFDNTLTFEIDKNASKSMVKLFIENQYKKPVKKVNTMNTHRGVKVALVTFKDEGAASDLASELGLV